MEYYFPLPIAKKKRFTIGFLDENAYDEYHTYLMTGVFKAAQKYNLNVIRFGHFAAHITSKQDFQIKMVLEHIRQYDLDGLIFLGWARAATFENHENFKKSFASIPLLSLGSGFEGIPSVYFPGDHYIREILLHLIDEHHYKNIAFIAPFWPDSRSNVYINTMKEYNLYRPELYVSEQEILNLDVPQRGRRAVSILLDERQVTVDAIVSLYNDESKAIEDELFARGLDVPSDVAVTSYEDGDIGRFASPSLTTVYFPWQELGYSGCEKMYELLTTGHIPQATSVAGKVILRDSCGCTLNVSRVKAGEIQASSKQLSQMTGAELMQAYQADPVSAGCKELDLANLFTVLRKDFEQKSSRNFLTELEMQLRRVDGFKRFSELEIVLTGLRRFVLTFVSGNPQALLWSESLFQQMQVLFREKKAVAWAHEEIRVNAIQSALRELGQILITCFDLQSIMDALQHNLQQLNIANCYIFIFKPMKEQGNLFDNCLLAFEFEKGIRRQTQFGDTTAAKEILSGILFSEDRPYTMLAQLLHVGNGFIGFAVYEPGQMDERVYQVLNLNISTALNSAIYIEKLDSNYKLLVEESHHEGMAEIVTGVLHNVSNILNGIHVSIHLLKDLMHTAPFEDFNRASRLLEEHMSDLEHFVSQDPRGIKLMQFYIKLETHFRELLTRLYDHVDRLKNNINLVNDIVMAQQSYTEIKSTLEELELAPIMEDALKMNLSSFEKNSIRIVRQYQELTKALVQKTKLFHILVNLIKNAQDAMLDIPEEKRQLILVVEQKGNDKFIRITDTGHGVPPELLDSIFAYGYTTKKGGHGFGLHSCANYMTEMKGRIWAESEGPGKGTTFVLQFK